MTWIVGSLLSAFFLGCYDLFTKHAVRENAVLPVLFLSTLTGAVIWSGLMGVDAACPGLLPSSFVTEPLTVFQHLQLALKSAIVSASWMFTYFALKHLPLSLGSPIRSTSPLWTLVGAVVILGERPSLVQILGILLVLGSFIALSRAGASEGIHFHRNKWVVFLIIGTMFGAASSLYDKYLLTTGGFSVSTVQAWFSVYLAVLFLPLAIGWKRRWWPRKEFHWRWSIPLIAIALLLADYVYFSALQDPEALVSVVMGVRRGSGIVGFAGGFLFFGEQNALKKLPAVLGIVLGVFLALIG